jgi:hypothetical protein
MSLRHSFVAPPLFGALLFVATVGGAHAQQATPPAPEKVALTATEQAATVQMLNQVSSLSGAALRSEVRRLAKQYVDQGLNLSGIVRLVKSGAGNKLGAVNLALSESCAAAPAGSAESTAVCKAMEVVADNEGDNKLPDTSGILTAGTGGAGTGGTGGGGGGGAGNTGTGTGNGTSGSSTTAGSAGSQSGTSLSGASGSHSIGTSTGGNTAGTANSPS